MRIKNPMIVLMNEIISRFSDWNDIQNGFSSARIKKILGTIHFTGPGFNHPDD